MLEVLIDNVLFMLAGRVFQKPVSMSMGANCVPFSPTYSFPLRGRLHTRASKVYAWRFCLSHLSIWEWNKAYHRHSLPYTSILTVRAG